ncbi:MAG: sensor histidine kinase [Chitinophagaceae bacterium]|nr:sensor histidine kinase [Chitinophagaceae bacterium]
MAGGSILPGEKERLNALYAYDILDSEPGKEFDGIVRLASQICDSPVSFISIVDLNRVWFKAKKGIADNQIDREYAFCSYTIENDTLFQVEDATTDKRFSNNKLVTGKTKIKFYAGVPIINRDGYKLGALSVLDTNPKTLSEERVLALETLAALAMKMIEARAQSHSFQNIKEVQDKILSIVSHDVRNPLASLRSVIGLWTDDLLSREEADEMLRVSAQQVDGAIDMISNLLNWAKLSAKISRDKKVINLRELLNKLYTAIAGVMTSKKNSFINNIAEDLIVEHNETLLQFVLQNLLSNAAKFTDHGSVSADASQTPGKLELVIKDTGMGMNEEIMDQLFDGKKNYPLWGTANEPGNGLGLMLIKDLLDKYKGSINVVSLPGEGTTVFITV